MKPTLVLAASLFLPLLLPSISRAEVPAYDFRQPLRDGVAVVGMECHKKNGTLEVGIYLPSDGPLKRMDLWRTGDLVEFDRKSFDLATTHQVERSCVIGTDRYRVRFEGLPGAANAMWQCGAATSATVTVWKNERQVLKEDFDNRCHDEAHGIRSALFRRGADQPEIVRFPQP